MSEEITYNILTSEGEKTVTTVAVNADPLSKTTDKTFVMMELRVSRGDLKSITDDSNSILYRRLLIEDFTGDPEQVKSAMREIFSNLEHHAKSALLQRNAEKE